MKIPLSSFCAFGMSSSAAETNEERKQKTASRSKEPAQTQTAAHRGTEASSAHTASRSRQGFFITRNLTQPSRKAVASQQPVMDRTIGLGGRGYALVDGRVLVSNNKTGELEHPEGGLEHIRRLKFNPKLGAHYTVYALSEHGEVIALNAQGARQHAPAANPIPRLPATTEDFALANDGSVYYLDAGAISIRCADGNDQAIRPLGADVQLRSMALDYADRCWAADANNIRRLSTDGTTWEALGQPEGLDNCKLRTLLDGTVVADGGHGRVFRYADSARAWKSVPPEEESMRAFDQIYEKLRGPRASAELGIGPLAMQSARNQLRNTPWWKPSVFQSSRPGQKLTTRWANFWKAHYSLHSTRARGADHDMVSGIRREIAQSHQYLKTRPAMNDAIRNSLADAIDAADTNANAALDKLLHRLGLTIRDDQGQVGEDVNFKKMPGYRAASKATQEKVHSPDNVLYVLYQARRALSAGPENSNEDNDVSRKLKSLLDRNVFLPLTGRTVVQGKERIPLPHLIKNKYEALTGQLILDYARIFHAGEELAPLKEDPAFNDTVNDYVEAFTEQTRNHDLTKLRENTFSNLDRAHKVTQGIDYVTANLREKDGKLNRALTLQDQLVDDVADLYVRAALDMDREAKIVLRGRWGVGAGLVGIVRAALKKFFVSPELSGQTGREYVLDIHKKGAFTWIKVANRGKVGAAIGIKVGSSAKKEVNDKLELFGGLEGSLVPTAEKTIDNRMYVTINNDPPDQLRDTLARLINGDISVLELLEAGSHNRNDNDRRNIDTGRVNLNFVAGGQVRVRGSDSNELRIGPSVNASAAVLDYVNDDRRRFGPDLASHNVKVNQFSWVRKAEVGANLAGNYAFKQEAGAPIDPADPSAGKKAQFTENLPLLRMGIQKYWDRIAGPEIEQEIKFTQHGTYDSIRTEVLLSNLSAITGYPDIANALAIRPELMDQIRKVQRHDKSATLIYQLSETARQQLAAYDPARDGPYKPFSEGICHGKNNWAIQEIMVRHPKAYKTSASVPGIPVSFSSSADVELYAIHGRISFNYVDGQIDPDNPYTLAGPLMEDGPPNAPPGFDRLPPARVNPDPGAARQKIGEGAAGSGKGKAKAEPVPGVPAAGSSTRMPVTSGGAATHSLDVQTVGQDGDVDQWHDALDQRPQEVTTAVQVPPQDGKPL